MEKGLPRGTCMYSAVASTVTLYRGSQTCRLWAKAFGFPPATVFLPHLSLSPSLFVCPSSHPLSPSPSLPFLSLSVTDSNICESRARGTRLCLMERRDEIGLGTSRLRNETGTQTQT